jgi:hypothetical protein
MPYQGVFQCMVVVCTEDLCNLDSTTDIINAIKSVRMRFTGYEACTGR